MYFFKPFQFPLFLLLISKAVLLVLFLHYSYIPAFNASLIEGYLLFVTKASKNFFSSSFNLTDATFINLHQLFTNMYTNYFVVNLYISHVFLFITYFLFLGSEYSFPHLVNSTKITSGYKSIRQ